MTYTLIVLDLDDTLLTSDLAISARTKDALLKAQHNGARVVLASGRPTGAMKRYALELGLERHGGFLISFNGAVVTDCTNLHQIFRKSLSVAHMREIHDHARRHGVSILGYHEDRIITPRENPYTEVESTLTGLDVEQVDDFPERITENSIKVIVVDDPERLQAVAESFRPHAEGRMNMVFSKPFFLEFTDLGIDKRHSLALLCERLKIPPAQVMAVGDSFNDMGMLEFAGLAVAMGNARDEVKAIADHITASHDQDGVALAVERFILSE
jgi:hypothetical protein